MGNTPYWYKLTLSDKSAFKHASLIIPTLRCAHASQLLQPSLYALCTCAFQCRHIGAQARHIARWIMRIKEIPADNMDGNMNIALIFPRRLLLWLYSISDSVLLHWVLKQGSASPPPRQAAFPATLADRLLGQLHSMTQRQYRRQLGRRLCRTAAYDRSAHGNRWAAKTSKLQLATFLV